MAETALVLAILLLLIFGIMDFSRLMYSYHLVDNAARLGTRFAAVRGSNCQHYVSGANDTWPCPASKTDASNEIANYVSQQSIIMGLGPIPASKVNTVWSFFEGCAPATGSNTYLNMPGCQVAVTVNYTYQFWLPFMPNLPGGIPLTSTSTMLISY